MDYLTTLFSYICYFTPNGRMRSDELESKWNKVVVAYFNVLSQNLSAETEKIIKNFSYGSDIRILDLPSTKQECQPFHRNVLLVRAFYPLHRHHKQSEELSVLCTLLTCFTGTPFSRAQWLVLRYCVTSITPPKFTVTDGTLAGN
jgi:hypothetical protein